MMITANRAMTTMTAMSSIMVKPEILFFNLLNLTVFIKLLYSGRLIRFDSNYIVTIFI